LATAERTVKVLEFLLHTAAVGHENALTDALVAASLAQAAVQGAAANVRVNAASLEDAVLAGRFQAQIEAFTAQAEQRVAEIRQIVEARQGRP
ncbi:MAG: cyclodeaminase/cyclohydrolase family protein, partial [Chloroflexia bacterium]